MRNYTARLGRRSFENTTRILAATVICGAGLILAGCGSLPGVKYKVDVPPLLTPLVDSNKDQMTAEINRLAEVKSLRGKVDVQFLDTSFAKCGVAEKYSTAEGTLVLQRPGQVYLAIQAPFVGTKIAEMSSNGQKFTVAVFQGDTKYRRFVTGTNSANYSKLESDADVDCDESGRRMSQSTTKVKRAVGALSGLRPQHITDALLIRPIESGSGLVYVQSQQFVEETLREKQKVARPVVHGYYVLDELSVEGGAAEIKRRFWFDRVQSLRLARVQTFDATGAVSTDVVYKDMAKFGESGVLLPRVVEMTRPQDRYSLRLTYQTPEAVRVGDEFGPQVFTLENANGLPEVDLDTRKGQGMLE